MILAPLVQCAIWNLSLGNTEHCPSSEWQNFPVLRDLRG